MAAKDKKPEAGVSSEFASIDELCIRHKTGRAVFAGACSVNGWRPGKVMTDNEYLAGIAKFTQEPAGGPFKKNTAR